MENIKNLCESTSHACFEKCLPCTFLSTSCTFPSTSCFTGSVETRSGCLPSFGHLRQGAVIINTPSAESWARATHQCLTPSDPGRPVSITAQQMISNFSQLLQVSTDGNHARSCAEILPSRSKKEHSASRHFLPRMISDSSVPFHSEQRPWF